MKHEEAVAFAEQWAKDWNAHDVEAVLTHFTDDAVFTSPLAERLFPDSGGVLSGKDALRRYWTEGVRLSPALYFYVTGVYSGTHTIVIRFRNEEGAERCEVLTFEGALVRTGHGTYDATSGLPVTARRELAESVRNIDFISHSERILVSPGLAAFPRGEPGAGRGREIPRTI